MKTETKKNLVNVLRWILFLPVASIVSLLISMLFYWMNTHSSYLNHESVFWSSVVFIVSVGLQGVAFIAAGVFIVPKFKRAISIVLLCIVALIRGTSIFIDSLALSVGSNYTDGFSPAVLIISSIACIIGSGYMVYYIWDNEDDFDFSSI